MKKLLNTSNFPFCHNVFKSCQLQRHQNMSICGKGVTLSMILMTQENIVGKEDIAQNRNIDLCFIYIPTGNKNILIFPQCFQYISKLYFQFFLKHFESRQIHWLLYQVNRKEAQEGQYRSTDIRQKITLQTAPPPDRHVFLPINMA